MRILQINTVYGIKSTGRTCLEVEKALLKAGYMCCTAYGHGPKINSMYVYRINNRFEYLFHNIMSRITGLEGYYSKNATKRLIKFIKDYNPDVIHLRNLHGHYLNLPLFFNFLKDTNIPIIQNLHDCWIYTGKCTYYTELKCEKWKKECEKCKKVGVYPVSWLFDRSKKMHQDKKKWFSEIKRLTVIGVSNWVTSEAKKSFLNRTNEIKCIYNWIDQETFRDFGNLRNEIRKKYNIPQDKFMIIGVSASWTKGTPRYEDFIKIASLLNESEILVLIGNSKEDLNKIPKIRHIQYIENTTELAKLYSCADVYVHCSIEDTFGKVIAEAMACGTPVIVYNSTGCAELVDKNSGYIVNPRNINEIIEKIKKIKIKTREFYSNLCIERVNSKFNYEKNINELIYLYEKLYKK